MHIYIYVYMHIFFFALFQLTFFLPVFPGMLQVIISNGMVKTGQGSLEHFQRFESQSHKDSGNFE